jgi:hypothetical protein
MIQDKKLWQSRAIQLVLFAAVSIQIASAGPGYIARWSRRVIDSRSLPAWERTALFLIGEDFADYVGFLREQIPEDGRVILPPHFSTDAESYVPMMQYFLFPRDIHNCGRDEVEECVQRVRGLNTFILAIEDFPPQDLAIEHKDYIPFADDRGLYVPRVQE